MFRYLGLMRLGREASFRSQSALRSLRTRLLEGRRSKTARVCAAPIQSLRSLRAGAEQVLRQDRPATALDGTV